MAKLWAMNGSNGIYIALDARVRLAAESSEAIYNVSVVELLAKTDKLHRKMVRAVKFADMHNEYPALYSDEYSSFAFIVRNSLSLQFSSLDERRKTPNKCYVTVVGLFDEELEKTPESKCAGEIIVQDVSNGYRLSKEGGIVKRAAAR